MTYTPSREQLKNSIRKNFKAIESDQNKGIPMPAFEVRKSESELISLPDPKSISLQDINPLEFLTERSSIRKFSDKGLTLEELSFLLFATQGVRKDHPQRPLRTVPSAGNRHPFETYLAVFHVEGLKEGIYHYLPFTHALEYLGSPEDLSEKVSDASMKQGFVGKSAVTFFWSVIPYRTEWRYLEGSYKVLTVDVGHLCQNLYFGCFCLGASTCAICAYDQDLSDELLGLDGDEEFVIYLAPVGFKYNE